jgi:hypothetical protein
MRSPLHRTTPFHSVLFCSVLRLFSGSHILDVLLVVRRTIENGVDPDDQPEARDHPGEEDAEHACDGSQSDAPFCGRQ